MAFRKRNKLNDLAQQMKPMFKKIGRNNSLFVDPWKKKWSENNSLLMEQKQKRCSLTKLGIAGESIGSVFKNKQPIFSA